MKCSCGGTFNLGSVTIRATGERIASPPRCGKCHSFYIRGENMSEVKKMEVCEKCERYDYLSKYHGQNICGECTEEILEKEGRLGGAPDVLELIEMESERIRQEKLEEEENSDYYRNKYVRDSLIDEIEDALRLMSTDRLKAVHTLLTESD